jgi:hypothetical protein
MVDKSSSTPVLAGLAVSIVFMLVFGLFMTGYLSSSKQQQILSSEEYIAKQRTLPNSATFVGLCGLSPYSSDNNSTSHTIMVARGKEAAIPICAWSSASIPKTLYLAVAPSPDFPPKEVHWLFDNDDTVNLPAYTGHGADQSLIKNGGKGVMERTNLHLMVDENHESSLGVLEVQVTEEFKSVKFFQIYINVT